ncbi:hypothetical protein A2Z33_02520 [Candidatus Gottesmanbacteria bacterium RBG_16_52_11]|uniref:Metallopeptidase family protein n=1 Tax=Candidatus Gottesmanbacteria bacterium RBG_16_52_11 TaxID=1798374 RepID=A0A1F5YNC0_9BACT|nr:MAG: hypothetical protein A2Z33_02520 [Candidatus Gottesmanbacteria bacterium RBG_16_52_11]
MDRATFESLVAEAVRGLPEEFSEKLDNVVVMVEDFPASEDLIELGIPDRSMLFGLYRGIPRSTRPRGYQGVTPDIISVYMLPVLSVCRTPEEVRAKVTDVVIHEIAHHFGISDEEIEQIKN